MSTDSMIGLRRVRHLLYHMTPRASSIKYIMGGGDHLIGSKCHLNSREHLGWCYSEG